VRQNEKKELKRQELEYKVTGRLPRRYRRETYEKWYLTDSELRTALKLNEEGECNAQG